MASKISDRERRPGSIGKLKEELTSGTSPTDVWLNATKKSIDRDRQGSHGESTR